MQTFDASEIQVLSPDTIKCSLPKDEVARVKGLGCLWDKRTADHFNVRVITVNGKLTGEQMTAVAQAARQFGSGEVTMTARLTLEIQGVPYENIEPLRAFLAERGLETGGTGAKVRPVVSCKGTTCQYGLIDTFALSEKVHRLFYEGYRQVKLPHKFKIAVGGCPNNCLKPDLNDVGIVGQRLPVVDLEKCRGCKVCQMEKNCPIHVAHLEDGKVVTKTNHAGGINGGITNGMPIHLHTVIKATPSIYQEQDSVDLQSGKEAKLTIKGRHDPAILHRAAVVVDSMIAIGLLEALCQQEAGMALIKQMSSNERGMIV